MRIFATFLFLLMGAFPSFAQSTATLVAVDAATGSFTVSLSKTDVRVYRTRPTLDVFINGTKGSFADLVTGMKVKVTMGEPGLAARIDATGIPNAAAPNVPAPSPKMPAPAAGAPSKTGADAVTQRLIGTRWVFWEKDGTTITFGADGKARTSHKITAEYFWKAVPGAEAIEAISPDGSLKFKMTFDPTFTTGEIIGKQTRKTRLIP